MAMSAGWTPAHLTPGTIPFFFRWEAALIFGTSAAGVSFVTDANRRAPRLAEAILLAAVIATAIVAVFVP
jgi:hypothetical protein